MSKEKEKRRQDQKNQKYKEIYDEWINSFTPEERAKMEAMGLDKPLLESRGVGAPELDESRVEAGSYDPFESLKGDPAEDGELDREGMAEFPPEREDLQESLRTMVAELYAAKKPHRKLAAIYLWLSGRVNLVKRFANDHKTTQKWMREESLRMSFRIKAIDEADKDALRKVAGELISQGNTKMSLEVLALVSGICYRGLSQTEIAKRHGITRAAVSKRCVEFCNRLGLPPSRAMKSEESRSAYAQAQFDYNHSVRVKCGECEVEGDSEEKP